jgi:RsiW-degrading membrane proteinase PrsW (M82 family)/CRP-like cAMP-binding protein
MEVNPVDFGRTLMDVTQILSYVITFAIPAFAVYMLFSLDVFSTGKGSTIILCLAWGAVGAFLLAKSLNSFFLQRTNYELLVQFIAPILEELLKSAILFIFIFQPRFRYAVDGAIYGFATGIGFSMSENLYYLGVGSTAAPSFTLAISRVLSTALMHATTSAVIGIWLGRNRRRESQDRVLSTIVGMLIAIGIHIVFNNLVTRLDSSPALVLLIGIVIGVGGSVLIAAQINSSLKDEKQRFNQSLTTQSAGVTANEVKALQNLGGDSFEEKLNELQQIFGKEKIPHIRRMLALQANVGILRNNLSSPCSDRLRKAWEQEITESRKEMDVLRRRKIGLNAMVYLRNVFPDEDAQTDAAQAFREKVAESDPTHVHKFDLFIVGSERAQTLSPDQLEKIALTLKLSQFFKELELADLENLSRACVMREYNDGEILFSEGDDGDTMYLIQQGEIEIYVKEGEQFRVINRRRETEIVGDLALLDGYPRSASARARGAVQVLMLRRENFLTFLRSRPQVIMAILKFLSKSVRYTTEIIETSVTWVTHITNGNYAEAQKLSYAAAAPLPTIEPTPSGKLPHTAMIRRAEFEGVTSASPAVLRGIFAKVTDVLEEREAATKAEEEASKQSSLMTTLGSLSGKLARITGDLPKPPPAAAAARQTGDIKRPEADPKRKIILKELFAVETPASEPAEPAATPTDATPTEAKPDPKRATMLKELFAVESPTPDATESAVPTEAKPDPAQKRATNLKELFAVNLPTPEAPVSTTPAPATDGQPPEVRPDPKRATNLKELFAAVEPPQPEADDKSDSVQPTT